MITQLELLSRPSSSVPSSGRSRDKRQTSASPKLNGRKNKDKYKVTEKDNGVRQYDEERVFHEVGESRIYIISMHGMLHYLLLYLLRACEYNLMKSAPYKHD